MSEQKTISLCKPCAVNYPLSKLKLVRTGIDKKITCDKCGRRRYGSEYIPSSGEK